MHFYPWGLGKLGFKSVGVRGGLTPCQGLLFKSIVVVLPAILITTAPCLDVELDKRRDFFSCHFHFNSFHKFLIASDLGVKIRKTPLFWCYHCPRKAAYEEITHYKAMGATVIKVSRAHLVYNVTKRPEKKKRKRSRWITIHVRRYTARPFLTFEIFSPCGKKGITLRMQQVSFTYHYTSVTTQPNAANRKTSYLGQWIPFRFRCRF